MDAPTRAARRSPLVALFERLDPGRPRLFLLGALALAIAMFVLQTSTLKAPISGEHNWRQADTYSVSYNFVHEKAPFFYPRIDWAGEKSGIMGMETPVYTYLAAMLMRVFGVTPFPGRLINWVTMVAALLAVGFSFRLTPRDWNADSERSMPNPVWIPAGIAMFAAVSPLVFFEGRQFQPDPAMAGITAIAAAIFHWFARKERWWLYAAGLVTYCLAVTVKSPALIAGPALWLLTFTASPRFRWFKPIARGIPFLIPIALFKVWDKWAHYLNDAFNGGGVYFATDFNWADYSNRIRDPAILKRFFWFVVPSYSSNWVLFPVLVVGLALAFRPGLRAVSGPMLLWLLMGTGLCAGLERLHWHWYYTFMFMLPLVYFGGIGVAALFEAVTAYRETRFFVHWAFWFVAFAFCATSWAGGAPKALEHVIGASQPLGNIGWTSEDGFFGLLVLQTAALPVAMLVPRRTGQWVAGFALGVATWVAIPRAVNDVRQILQWRSRESEWGDFDTHWAELRRNVDEVSTRLDRFVVDGGNPWFLHLVMRKGFAYYTQDIDSVGIDRLHELSMRFYVHFFQNGPVPNAFQGRTPIRQGERWEIYCVFEGCR